MALDCEGLAEAPSLEEVGVLGRASLALLGPEVEGVDFPFSFS